MPFYFQLEKSPATNFEDAMNLTVAKIDFYSV